MKVIHLRLSETHEQQAEYLIQAIGANNRSELVRLLIQEKYVSLRYGNDPASLRRKFVQVANAKLRLNVPLSDGDIEAVAFDGDRVKGRSRWGSWYELKVEDWNG